MTSNTIPEKTGDVAQNLLEAYGGALSKEETAFLEYVRQWPNTWGEGVSALILKRSLSKHAEALNAAAASSERYAKSLVSATWALVAATLVLAFIGIIQLFH